MKLTKEQLKELLLTILVGVHVRSAVEESRGKDFKYIEKIEEDFCQLARSLGYEDLIENFHGKIIPSNTLCLETDTIMEEYDEDQFWFTVELYLGKRDFYRDLTPTEEKELKKSKWFPDKIEKYYEKYRKEFEKHGVERLEIVKKNQKKKI